MNPAPRSCTFGSWKVTFLILLALVLRLPAQPAAPQPPPAAAPQPAPPPSPDPLMNLMLSQPRIDVESPVTATATFDPPTVQPGQISTYRIAFNALEESIEWRDNLTAPANLELRRGGHGQTLFLVGNAAVMQPLTCFNYWARASETGQFTMPDFSVTVYGKRVLVPAARLSVVADRPPSAPPANRLALEIATTNLFVGQAAHVNVIFPGAPAVASLGITPIQIMGHGLLMEQSLMRARYEARPAPGTTNGMQTLIFETIITPITAGNISAFAQAFIGLPPPPGAPATQPYSLVDSLPVELRVRPLPRSGELPGFTGGVGTFIVDPPQLATNTISVGAPVLLTVHIHGEGNLARLTPPPPPQVPDWHVVASSSEKAVPAAILAQGFTTFSYTLIPLVQTATATPPIPFSAFDPARAAYFDLTIPPVPVKVKAGALPPDLQAVREADALAKEPEKEPSLSDLASTPGTATASLAPMQSRAWFPLVQLAPGVFFLGLWRWDRRRRYLELHPGLVLRKQARRALRRERRTLHRAAQAGDATRFATAAVSALRVSSAPFYPAEPRALVGSDVLALVPEAERNGRSGEIVRRVFAVTDAARFSAAHGDAQELLALRADLDQVLDQLEARL